MDVNDLLCSNIKEDLSNRKLLSCLHSLFCKPETKQRGKRFKLIHFTDQNVCSYNSNLTMAFLNWPIVFTARVSLRHTTVFTYSHASTSLGQSERAYYLSYFITDCCTYNKSENTFDIVPCWNSRRAKTLISSTIKYWVSTQGMANLRVPFADNLVIAWCPLFLRISSLQTQQRR